MAGVIFLSFSTIACSSSCLLILVLNSSWTCKDSAEPEHSHNVHQSGAEDLFWSYPNTFLPADARIPQERISLRNQGTRLPPSVCLERVC